MKKLTIILVLILSLVISYFTATAVNLYNVSRLSKVSDGNVLTRNLIIMDYDSVDRSQLIESIMDVASQNNIFVSTGWFSDNANENAVKREPAHRTSRATASESKSHPEIGWL